MLWSRKVDRRKVKCENDRECFHICDTRYTLIQLQFISSGGQPIRLVIGEFHAQQKCDDHNFGHSRRENLSVKPKYSVVNAHETFMENLGLLTGRIFENLNPMSLFQFCAILE